MQVPYSPVGMTQPASTALRGPSGEGGTPDAFGAGVGRGLSQLSGAADQLSTYLQTKRDQASQFAAMEKFSAFQTTIGDDLTELGRSYDPSSGGDLTLTAQENFAKRKDEFIASLPPELQDEFSARAAEVYQGYHSSAAKYQIDSIDNYTLQGVNTAYDNARGSLDQDGSKANLDAQKARIEEMLQNSTLTEAKKIELRRQMYAGLEIVSYKSEYRSGKIEAGALGVGSSAAAGATALLEGALPPGHNYDVAGIADAAEATIVKQINPLVWAAQTDPTKAALISLTAFQRELPASVIEALNSGDHEALAKAVEALGGDQHKTEAAVIRGVLELPHTQLDTDPRYADIPYEDRLAARKDADIEASQQASADAAAAKAQNAQITNALFNGLADGTAGQTDIDTLRTAGVLTDYDDIKKAQDIYDKRQGDVGLVARGWDMLNQGQTFMPQDEDHKKIENALIGKEGLANIDKISTDYAANYLVPITRQMHDIPTDVSDILQGMVRSNDATKALWAYDLLNQLHESAGDDAYNSRVPEAVRKDAEFWRNAKDQFPPDQLLGLIRGGANQEQRTQMTALRNDAGAMLRDSKTGPQLHAGVVDAFLGGGLFGAGRASVQSTPWAAAGLQSDFDELFTEAYSRFGNVDQAKASAQESLKRNWGVTAAGGGVLMKYPPEKAGYRPIDGNFNWIQEQGNKELGIQPGESFELVSDEQTRQEMEAGLPASYQVVIKNRDGVPIRTWNPAKNWSDFSPGAQGDRIFFDPKEFQDRIDAEWRAKQARATAQTAVQVLQDAVQHHQETGVPIPSQIIQDAQDQMDRLATFGGM